MSFKVPLPANSLRTTPIRTETSSARSTSPLMQKTREEMQGITAINTSPIQELLIEQFKERPREWSLLLPRLKSSQAEDFVKVFVSSLDPREIKKLSYSLYNLAESSFLKEVVPKLPESFHLETLALEVILVFITDLEKRAFCKGAFIQRGWLPKS